MRRNQADENRHRSPVEQRFQQRFDQLPSHNGDGKYEEKRRQCRPADRLRAEPHSMGSPSFFYPAAPIPPRA